MSGWRRAATGLSLDQHRPLQEVRAPALRGGARPFAGGADLSFEDDWERFHWEREQHAHFRNDDGMWLDASGCYILGAPIYPGAVLIERNSRLLAIEQAREMGFCLGHELWTEAFGWKRAWRMHLRAVRQLADQHPHIVRCVLRLPELDVEGAIDHVRCFKLDELVDTYLGSPIATQVRVKYRDALAEAKRKAAPQRRKSRERKLRGLRWKDPEWVRQYERRYRKRLRARRAREAAQAQ